MMFFVCIVFINLQNAPDTVNHEIILIKLDLYQIRGLRDSWLKSFLRNRKQYVFFPGHSSSVKTVTCGASQGSTLGFFLFVLYINNLFKKRLQHSYFPVKFETFLRTYFFTVYLQWLLLPVESEWFIVQKRLDLYHFFKDTPKAFDNFKIKQQNCTK